MQYRAASVAIDRTTLAAILVDPDQTYPTYTPSTTARRIQRAIAWKQSHKSA